MVKKEAVGRSEPSLLYIGFGNTEIQMKIQRSSVGQLTRGGESSKERCREILAVEGAAPPVGFGHSPQ